MPTVPPTNFTSPGTVVQVAAPVQPASSLFGTGAPGYISWFFITCFCPQPAGYVLSKRLKAQQPIRHLLVLGAIILLFVGATM